MELLMKRRQRQWRLIGIVVLLMMVLSACNLSEASNAGDGPADTPSGEEKTTEEATSAVDEVMENLGTITGQLSYPSEFLPSQRVVAFNIEDIQIYYAVDVVEGGTYELDVLPGTYVVLAYVIDPETLSAPPGMGAAYSKAVLCGLEVGCDDHGLAPVTVGVGETVSGIDPADWYLPPGEDAGWPDDPMNDATGVISGELGYPSEFIPAMRVVAFDVYSEAFYYVDTEENQVAYSMAELPPGTYNVVAFIREETPHMGGGYSNFVTCGLSADCDDHGLIDVNVYGDSTTENVDPVDFYATPKEMSSWPDYPMP
jgi:hypothetical protein